MQTPSEDLALTLLSDAKLAPLCAGLTPARAGDYIIRLAADIIREREEDRIARLFGPAPGKVGLRA